MKSARIVVFALTLGCAFPLAALAAWNTAFTDLYARSKDSVTSIRIVTHKVSEKNEPMSARGSGFVWTSDGYVATAAHLATDIKDIEITIGKRTYPARLIGADPQTDIALMKIDGVSGLKPLPIGNSDTVEYGEYVAAIGDPFVLVMSITHGTVSGKKRALNDPLDEYIQTDAAINPGNSGGPLINLAGAVIGINVLVVAEGNNTGFAVPINLVKAILPILKQKGKVERVTLGSEFLDIAQLTDKDVARLNLSPTLLSTNETGVLIGAVRSGSPAEKAGLTTGDILLSWNGRNITNPLEFTRTLRLLPAGTAVSFSIRRQDKVFQARAIMEPLRDQKK